MVAQQNLRNFAADYKAKVIPPSPCPFLLRSVLPLYSAPPDA